MTYGPPGGIPRAATSPTILLLVSGLTGILGFLIGMFAGIGLAEPSASPRKSPEPASTVLFEETGPPATTPGVGTTPDLGSTPGSSTGPNAQDSAAPNALGSTAPNTQGSTAPNAQGAGDGPLGGARLMMVGTDLQPGTYTTTGLAPGQPACMWARLNSTEFALTSVIDSGFPTGPATVTIAPTDKAFQTAGCAPWTRQGG